MLPSYMPPHAVPTAGEIATRGHVYYMVALCVETYSLLREFADSWALLALFGVFVGVGLWVQHGAAEDIQGGEGERARPAKSAEQADHIGNSVLGLGDSKAVAGHDDQRPGLIEQLSSLVSADGDGFSLFCIACR